MSDESPETAKAYSRGDAGSAEETTEPTSNERGIRDYGVRIREINVEGDQTWQALVE